MDRNILGKTRNIWTFPLGEEKLSKLDESCQNLLMSGWEFFSLNAMLVIVAADCWSGMLDAG